MAGEGGGLASGRCRGCRAGRPLRGGKQTEGRHMAKISRFYNLAELAELNRREPAAKDATWPTEAYSNVSIQPPDDDGILTIRVLINRGFSYAWSGKGKDGKPRRLRRLIYASTNRDGSYKGDRIPLDAPGAATQRFLTLAVQGPVEEVRE